MTAAVHVARRTFSVNPAFVFDQQAELRARHGEAARVLQSALFKIRPLWRYVLIRRSEGKTTVEIADELMMTRQRVEQIENTALERMRRVLIRMGVRSTTEVI